MGLGVLVGNKLTMGQQCAFMAKKANSILGYVIKSVVSRSMEVFFPHNCDPMRPLLEYCIQVRVPQFKRSAALLEKEQWRTTNMTRGLKHHPY